jgi:hypothetical protein
MMNEHWNDLVESDQRRMQEAFDFEAMQYEEMMRQNAIQWQQARI